jgi:hypothetical protein
MGENNSKKKRMSEFAISVVSISRDKKDGSDPLSPVLGRVYGLFDFGLMDDHREGEPSGPGKT